MSNHNFHTEIRMDVDRVQEILKSNIFALEYARHPLKQSAFTELMICLHDLLQKCKKSGVPVDFTEAVDVTSDTNITDLVSGIRGVVCHITSKTHQLHDEDGKFTFNISYGACVLGSISGVEIKSDFDDDVCFFFGKRKIYLNRHIIRAFEEAKANLIPPQDPTPN